MIQDVAKGFILKPTQPDVAATERLVRERQPNYFTYASWLRLDELEVTRGKAAGRPRIKFTSVDDMLVALGR
jgi:ferredoxin--NADP+ reductase